MKLLILIVALVRTGFGAVNYPIPADFLLGAATSAYQIEGGWDADGKGPSINDVYYHAHPELDNGDIASDSYHKVLEDIEMVKYLGVTHYRFSLSWSRLLPNGLIAQVNPAGVEYYNTLIQGLKANGIEPMVTLYHGDLPQALRDQGGFVNETMIEWFSDYAQLAFELYGRDVKYWVTFNEPRYICGGGYDLGDGIGDYICAHMVLKSHAEAYHIYDAYYRPTQNGKVAIVLDTHWMEPNTDLPQDIEAAERAMQFNVGWFGNPIYHPNGNYPQVMIDRIGERSLLEGFNVSRLPVFTQEEIDYIKGTFDFFGLNSYSTALVEWIEEQPIGEPAFYKDININSFTNDSWETQATGWGVVPWGLRKYINWVDQTYNRPEIIITENGYSNGFDGWMDDRRIDFYREYLSSVLEAIYLDGANVTGYTVWSLMDNLEWASGFSIKFGLYEVDFNDPNRTRTIKGSAEYYRQIIQTRCLVDSCQAP